MRSYTFLAFFVVFHHKICVLIIFISFFDEVHIKFRNRILTNQKHELVVSNCQHSHKKRKEELLPEELHCSYQRNVCQG